MLSFNSNIGSLININSLINTNNAEEDTPLYNPFTEGSPKSTSSSSRDATVLQNPQGLTPNNFKMLNIPDIGKTGALNAQLPELSTLDMSSGLNTMDFNPNRTNTYLSLNQEISQKVSNILGIGSGITANPNSDLMQNSNGMPEVNLQNAGNLTPFGESKMLEQNAQDSINRILFDFNIPKNSSPDIQDKTIKQSEPEGYTMPKEKASDN